MTDLTATLNAVGTLKATLGAGKINVNDYTLTVEEVENGTKISITRGSQTDTVIVPDYSEDEQERVTAETERVKAETARESTEIDRATSEVKRTEAETARATAEVKRTEAETSRATGETKRTEAEAVRATAETKRTEAETVRATAEADRADAETARESAEAAREAAETERQTEEAARDIAEIRRNDAEAERTEAETARVTADAKRQTINDAQVAKVETAAANAKESETFVAENIDSIAKEVTAADILAVMQQELTLLHQIVEEGTGGKGSLNGFSFSRGKSGELIISYVNPDDESDTATSTFASKETANLIAQELASINESLHTIAGTDSTAQTEG